MNRRGNVWQPERRFWYSVHHCPACEKLKTSKLEGNDAPPDPGIQRMRQILDFAAVTA